MNSLAIEDKLQTIKEIAIGGCEDIEVSEKIFDLCDEILGLVNSASCSCQHSSNSRDNEPCCRCDNRIENINKAKVDSLEIITQMLDDKPYYELKYRLVGKNDYSIGYSSYDLKIVLDYIDTYFEIVKNDITTNADRIRNMSDEELAEFLCKVKSDYQWMEHEFPSEEEHSEWEEWLQSEAE